MEFSIGNSKLGKDTLILNITSATSCPSKRLGLCKHPEKCYAMKAERMYPACRPFRDRQTAAWDAQTAEEIAADINKEVMKSNMRGRTPIRFVRLSESGDFRNQADVEKANRIAWIIYHESDVITYGYTARKDLDFSKKNPSLVLNGTYFMIDNQFNPVPMDQTDQTLIALQQAEVCDGNCPECDKCKTPKGRQIYIKYH